MKKRSNDRFISFMRFFLLGLAIALLAVLIVIGFSVYRSSTREIEDSNLVVVEDTEALTEEQTESETEQETEVQTESETEQETAPVTEAETQTELIRQTETAAQSETVSQTETAATAEEVVVIEGQEVSVDSTAETAAEEVSTGVYRTLTEACNFRSEAGYEDEDGNDTTICTYPAGTVVEVLEEPGGWTKVRIDGVVGYVGAQFVSSEE